MLVFASSPALLTECSLGSIILLASSMYKLLFSIFGLSDFTNWVKAGHKPGSVHASTEVGLQRVGGYLSGTAVTDGLERHT